jgi:hypothetical protein
MNKNEMADKFFMKRAAKFVKAKALDAWILYTTAAVAKT